MNLNGTKESSCVYHYTTAAGLKGIIENRSIWATNVNFLNDASEYQHGVDMISQELRDYDLQSEKSLTPKIESTLLKSRVARAVMLGLWKHTVESKDFSLSTFVASFFDSAEKVPESPNNHAGDVLEQWRAYSRNSRGFSIGFNKAILEQQVCADQSRPGSISCASHCVYNSSEKRSEARQIATSLAPLLPAVLEDFLDVAFIELEKEVRRRAGQPRPGAFL